MGQIQKATNQLVSTALGTAIAGKHFSEQQKLRELQGAEFSAQNVQDQRNLAMAEDATADEIAGLENGKFEIEADLMNNIRDQENIGTTVKHKKDGSMSLSYRDSSSGQFLSRKEVNALEKEYTRLIRAGEEVNNEIERKKLQKSLFHERLEQARDIGKAGSYRFGNEYIEVKTREEKAKAGGNK